MKLIGLSAAVFLMALPSAFAEVRGPVTVRSVSFDGTMLDASYSTGGGCSDHHSDVELDYDKKSMIMLVKIVDVADKADLCEALIPGNVSINLKTLIATYAKSHGMGGNTFIVELPKVMVTTF